MTYPADTAQSGAAVDAVRTLQAELANDYSEIRSAEIQLAEAILSAHAVTVSGQARLQDIQRQLIDAINNPVAALDTPAGERQFLLFLRGKIAEISDIVDEGALTDEDHARLTRALGSGYLLSASERAEPPPPPPAGAATADPAGGMMPALGSALGALPQAAQGAATAPAQGAGGLAGAAGPLAGLASGLADRAGQPDLPKTVDDTTDERHDRDVDDDGDGDGDEDTGRDADEDRDTDDRSAQPPPQNREPPDDGPAQTRPAVLL
ncbi:hypothetical protein CQY20_32155 [Mycolicibacterium agri]|uniref:Biofilm regulator BssS n=1 Tax=Mycolicibacterium agri TaxID=36811 RepID=A0A2A7MNQ0_MYCAG|nr:DUF4226 domain-containing protein [Mycolicibacterium agri]PEG33180.1 hypothetical protein CQY20_32155 [Mycolicibacterium agri]GFG53321.1 hypothetical protein MAGR_47620 [Mycolicibacterium agri]